MLKNTKNNREVNDTVIILEKYKKDIELIQKSLKQLEIELSKLQGEGLVEVEKLVNNVSMLQKLSTSVEFKAKNLICNNNTIETSLPEE
ncbi:MULTISPECIES: hypothetical protein [unclassified Lysinibacillus]|uniref:hypothetical protein n=1 Tax=unclassified Lysinibacillus TaxID=2636778 RepID=UPI0020134EE9|nr:MULTISPECIES: hypothetical protein [unclassified Lysinibacillus]MCL1697347.1 hypothetical protein [Lysinibacillus sp. BPa_S21]MCL1702187.1 hypothetical protein [Lysinibacillus sp. Bpr_S20]